MSVILPSTTAPPRSGRSTAVVVEHAAGVEVPQISALPRSGPVVALVRVGQPATLRFNPVARCANGKVVRGAASAHAGRAKPTSVSGSTTEATEAAACVRPRLSTPRSNSGVRDCEEEAVVRAGAEM